MGVTSVLVLLLTWAALDDITTGNEPSFVGEYTLLALSDLWFAAIAGWLIVRRRTVIGLVSLAAVALAALAWWSLPHRGEPSNPINVLGFIPIIWFVALSVWMLVARGHRWTTTTPEPAARAGHFRVPGRA